ncbi:DUF6357 family protein [Micromonospora sp. NPDC018662]|uniref:DUF6357 family protein n=1 Tax=Micromonospora sp. NPDC018662 TaxID=3364238 RepID=UPI0037ACA004
MPASTTSGSGFPTRARAVRDIVFTRSSGWIPTVIREDGELKPPSSSARVVDAVPGSPGGNPRPRRPVGDPATRGAVSRLG